MVKLAEDQGRGVEARQEKHVALYHAIEKLETVENRLRNLRDRIRGEGPDKPEIAKGQPEKGNPPLMLILNDSPDWLHGKRSDLTELINQIEEILF